jgi:ketosteroid isomerase-like protein
VGESVAPGAARAGSGGGDHQLRAAYERGFAAVEIDERLAGIDGILVDGDLASVQSRSAGKITIRDGGAVVSSEARELFVLRRVRGEWKIAQYMFQHVPTT